MKQRTRRRQTSRRYDGPLTLMKFHRLLKWRRALVRSRLQCAEARILHSLANFAAMVQMFHPPIDHTVGDYVSRDGSDVQLVTYMDDGGDSGEYTCVVAPASGWCAVGDVESNMARRYSKVEYTPGAPIFPINDRNHCQNSAWPEVKP